MSTIDLAAEAAKLETQIGTEPDARKRMKLCRAALGLGRQATQQLASLSSLQIKTLESLLRTAHRASNGHVNPNRWVTLLAKAKMALFGFTSLPLVKQSLTKLVGTDTACLAISSQALPYDWFEPEHSQEFVNNGSGLIMSVGADGDYSLTIRHIEASEPFLKPDEYKKVLEASPDFSLNCTGEVMYFGAAENVTNGAFLAIPSGIYRARIVTLIASRGPRFVATICTSDAPVPAIASIPEFREMF